MAAHSGRDYGGGSGCTTLDDTVLRG